jgi:hypothetical protein
MIITKETKGQLRRGDIIECVNAVGEQKGCVVLGITEEYFFYVYVYPQSMIERGYSTYKSSAQRSFWSDYTSGRNHIIKTGESVSEAEIMRILGDNCLVSSYGDIPKEFLTTKLKLDHDGGQQVMVEVLSGNSFFGPWNE